MTMLHKKRKIFEFLFAPIQMFDMSSFGYSTHVCAIIEFYSNGLKQVSVYAHKSRGDTVRRAFKVAGNGNT